MRIIDSFEKVFKDKDKILVVTAHPDDNEVICGATVARLIDEGKKVRLVVMTNGGKGTEDKTIPETEFAKLRISEQIKAGIELGIPESENFNLNIPDGELEDSLDNIEKIAWHIREFKPDIIITHNPEEVINTFDTNTHWVNHRDHRNIATITCDAAYPYSRDRGFFPDHFDQGLEPHTVEYLLFSDSYTHPDRVYFKVDKYIDKKRKALEVCQSVINQEHLDGYIDELKYDDGYYEPLRLVKI